MEVLYEKEKNLDFSLLKPMVLFTYSTENLPKKDKVRFFYALNGRNQKFGFLKKFNSIHLGITNILVPIKFKPDFIDFLRKWNVSFKAIEMLVE